MAVLHGRWLAYRACVFAMLMGSTTTAGAVKVTDNLDLGGAVRMRWDDDSSRNIHKFGLDTVMFSAKYTSDSWIGAARYRFYGQAYPYQYTAHFGDIHFAEYAWVGYKFDDKKQLQVGLNQVPFGLQPLYSDTFYETLGNVVGLEDLEELGVKYVQDIDDWNVQLGYYARPGWPGQGTSHGTTYSVVVTSADASVVGGSDNEERGLAIARLARKVQAGNWKGEVGASVLSSTLHNRGTGRDGRRHAYAVHYAASNGPWDVKLQFARQQMSPKNPGGNQTVTVGSYDGTFNLAGRGNLYLTSLGYEIPGSYLGGWISGMKLYGSYSLYDKSDASFRNSQRFILGTSFSLKSLQIYLEWLNGRNDPYIGGSSYTQSLGSGGINSWKSQFYMNVGYYF